MSRALRRWDGRGEYENMGICIVTSHIAARVSGPPEIFNLAHAHLRRPDEQSAAQRNAAQRTLASTSGRVPSSRPPWRHCESLRGGRVELI